MPLFTFQKADYPRWGGAKIRIYRFAIWRWAWIWSKHIGPRSPWEPQRHNEAAEIAYMRAHPEIWPPGEDYSVVYAEHHLAPLDPDEYIKLIKAGQGKKA